MRNLFGLLLLSAMWGCTSSSYRFLVGNYSNTREQGVFLVEYLSRKGEFHILDSTQNIRNPSFLEIDKEERQRFWVVLENDTGKVVLFEKRPHGFQKISETVTHGAAPCHIQKRNNRILVTNYMGGNVTVYDQDWEGGLKETQLLIHKGSGANIQRQQMPHPHSTGFSSDGSLALVCDLGTDQVWSYANEAEGLLLKQKLNLAPGSGPRHLVFHPRQPFVYVIQELTGQVSQIKIEHGEISLVKTWSILPDSYRGDNSSADIHLSPDGQYLYTSNRVSNLLVSFKVNPKNGALEKFETIKLKGEKPRNFNISPDGRFLFVAFEKSNELNVYKMRKGKLFLHKGKIQLTEPVCIKFF